MLEVPRTIARGGFMMSQLDRRRFLGAGAALALAPHAAVLGANDRIAVGVMGMGGRGTSLARTFAGDAGVEVTYVCDPDPRRANQAQEAISKAKGSPPK